MSYTKGVLFAFLASLGLSTQSIFITYGLMESNKKNDMILHTGSALFITLITSQIFLVMGFIIGRYFGYDFFAESRLLTVKAILYIICEGILGSLSGLLLVTFAIAYIGPARTSALRSSNPLFTIILAVVLLDEKASLLSWIAILVLVTGLIIVSYRKDDSVDHTTLASKNKIKGNVLAVSAGFFFALSQIARGAALNNGATPNTVQFFGTLTAIVLLVIILYIRSGGFKHFPRPNLRELYFFSASGFSTLVGRYALLLSFTYIPVWLAVAIRNTQPLIVIVLACIFLNKTEQVNPRLLLGTTLIIGGAVISLMS